MSPARTIRRVGVLAAVFGIVGCDATRTLESTIDPTATEAVASAATAVGTSAPSVNNVSLANPSFEGGYTGWSFPGTPGSFVDIGPLWQATHGSSSVDLNGFDPGSVSQNIATIPGVQYTVQFDLAGNPGSPQGVKTMVVSAGATSANYSFNTQGKSGTNMGWTAQTFTFTATVATTTLTFKSTYFGNGNHPDKAQGPAIDNVRITWVPTPTTVTVSFGPGPFVYNGSAFTATSSVSPAAAGTPTITYSGDCTNAGSTCTATATVPANGQYSGSTATADITIDKAPTTTSVSFGAGPFVYNGSAYTATASVSPAAGSATITYSGDCTSAGSTCSATATFAGSDNYESSSASAGITIDKAPTTTSVSFGAGPFIYNGSAFTATASVSPAAAGSATIAYSGECTFAGTCNATATYAGSGNYLPSSASASITIKYPVVTSGDKCKNGGWQYLTDDLGNRFKNQGDCVSYVATKGRNKGAGGI